MSAITDEVNISITAAAAKVAQAGFGLPLLLSHSAAWTERTREYSSAAEVLVDFPASGSKNTPEYLAAAAVFAQTPHPPSLVIGRCALPATMQYEFTPVVKNSYAYTLSIDGVDYTYTSDSSATAAEITGGLKTLIDAASLALTTSQQSTSTVLRIVANTAGAWFSIGTKDIANLALVQNHADPGQLTDLAAIAVERNDWYAVVSWFNSKALATVVAGYCNTNRKLFVFQTVDNVVPGTAKSGTDDVAEYLQNAAYDYAAPIFSYYPADMADAAWLGKCLPYTPGNESWKFKLLSGMPAGAYTSTQRANMRAKNCNFYEPTLAVNMTEEGYCSSGKYIDFVRYIDFLIARIGERVYGDMVNMPKIPYDDDGITTVLSEVSGQLKSDEQRRVLLPGWTATAPKAVAAPNADRQTRTLNNVAFSCVYSGAIHKVNITGTVSL